MREILFRGKRTDNGEWVLGLLARYNSNFETANMVNELGILIPVLSSTVGQYTGLTDNNSKKIFEGDIVKFNKHIYQIVFEVGSFALLDKDGEIISKIGGINDHCYPLMELYLECCWEDDWAYDIEVIGNIHDNSEFLRSGS